MIQNALLHAGHFFGLFPINHGLFPIFLGCHHIAMMCSRL